MKALHGRLLRSLFLVVMGAAVGSSWGWSLPTPSPGSRHGLRWAEVVIEPHPTLMDVNSLAERLYGWNCMPCHGIDGRGDGPVGERLGLRPRDFTRRAFRLRTSNASDMPSDDDLYRTITAGILPGGMPAFPQLDPIDRWALVEHIKRLARGAEGDAVAPRAFDPIPLRATAPPCPDRLDPDRGAWLYRNGAQCAVCHGDRGKGDGPAAAGLVDPDGRPSILPDLTRGELTFKAGDRLEDIVRVLWLGMPGSPMPSFSALPTSDLWDLAACLVGRYEEIPEGERVWLRGGCQSCHTLGRGRRVGPDLAGVSQRRSAEWLRRWLADPPRMLLDPSVRAEFRDYPTPMPKLDLPDREVDLLVEFLTSAPSSTPRSSER